MADRRCLQHVEILNDTCAWTPNRGGPTERGGPNPGWAYRTGSEGGNLELRNSSFSDFRQNHRTTIFLRGFLKNPSVESVLGEHTQLFTEGFPVIFHEGPFSSWNRLFSC